MIKMEKSQNEVTDKIRHSIKEKLKEINTFVDDELPDYIMILIANKRNKHHMEKDLSLFLGSQTVEFTNWLWDLVNAFKAGAKIKSSKPRLTIDSQRTENFQCKDIRSEEDDILSYDPEEQGESLCLEVVNESSVNQENLSKPPEKSDDSKILTSSDDDMPENSYLLLSAADKPQRKTNIKREKEDANTGQIGLSNTSSSGQMFQKSAKVYPVQRMKTVPYTALEKRGSTAKSFEPSKTEYNGVASVVCFTQKKYGGTAAALQANKLLLKAVNDATKSVLSGRDINDYYKPTPIKELAESKKISDEIKENVHVGETAIESLIGGQDSRLLKHEMNKPSIKSPENSEQISVSRHVISLNSEIDIFEEANLCASAPQPPIQLEEENTVTPHFIVTLDGVDFSSLKRKRSLISDEEPMEIDEEEEDDDFNSEVVEQINEKKLKIAERCKYWPACKNNVECVYHHPTIPCKCFPNCKFGDKCLYIHPNCKFDALCSKRDCPYTHCSVRKYSVAPTAVINPVNIQKSKIVCKYFPRCTAKPCPFIHPKPCRFGTQCRAPMCPFGHFQIPDRSQLKWKAI